MIEVKINMIVMIDNKESFTYNLVDYLNSMSHKPITVIDVDDLNIAQLRASKPSAIVISPGPGRPEDYPVLYQLIQAFAQEVPILGVCLGFQILVSYYGGEIIPNVRPVHGHVAALTHTNEGIFYNLPQQFHVMRYHSLMANRQTMPNSLVITAETSDRIIMGIQHREHRIFGVQYHPESILSQYGHKQLQLFLEKIGDTSASSF